MLYRDGKRQSSKSFDSPEAAENFKNMIAALGLPRALAELDDQADGITLDEILEDFLKARSAKVRSPRTIKDYRRDYTNWISPHFGDRAAAGITEADVQRWIDQLHALQYGDGLPRLAPKTIAQLHALLHSMFKFAAAPSRRLLPAGFDPCASTELPTRVKRPPKGMRINAWLAMHAGLQAVGERNGCGSDAADLGHFLIASGWRISEAIALDETGCEDDGEFITCYVLQVMRRQADNTFALVEDAKSRAAGRRVTLDRDASAMVRRRLATVPAGGLLFTRAGQPWTYSTFRNIYWVGAAKVAGMKAPKPHELRHTAVGIFHMSGASLPEIQRRIGHESIQTTIDVYGSMIDDMSTGALDNVAAILRGEQPKRELGRA